MLSSNIGLSTRGSMVPSEVASILEIKDEILNGKRLLFSGGSNGTPLRNCLDHIVILGYSESKTLIYIIIPITFGLHVLFVLGVSYRNLAAYIWPLERKDSHNTLLTMMNCLLYSQVAFSAFGLCLFLLNIVSPKIFWDCVEPVLHLTLATTLHSGLTFQWIHVSLNGCLLFVVASFVVQVKRCRLAEKGKAVHNTFTHLIGLKCDKHTAIQAWCHHMHSTHKQRRLQSAMVFILVALLLCFCSVPTFVFVLANSIRKQWWNAILGNPIVLAIVNRGLLKVVVPRVAARIVQMRTTQGEHLHSLAVVESIKSQVGIVHHMQCGKSC